MVEQFARGEKSALISVVIPTYNRASLIARAIDSALGQTYPTVEVVVVDDGSTDHTAELIADRYGHDLRVRYLAQPNSGVSAARNRGLAAARGDYVALLDSDDVWRLEVQMCCLRALPGVEMIWTDMEAIGPLGNTVSPRYLRTMYKNSYQWYPNYSDLFTARCSLREICPSVGEHLGDTGVYWGEIYSQMMMGNLVHTSTVLLSRQRMEQVRGFNEALKVSGEDYDFHLRTCREGLVAFVDASSIKYQVGAADQLTQPVYAIHMARNFLTTISQALDRDRDRIKLPASMLAAVHAFAYSWIGSEYFELGEHLLARMSLRTSLHYHTWQPRVWLLYLLSILPASFAHLALEKLRRFKKSLGRIAGRVS